MTGPRPAQRGRGRWRRAAAALLLGGAAPALAQAQAADTARTAAAPAVAPAAGGAAGLPATEFETYAVSGRGVRYTASLTGLYTTGTVQRTFLSTSHTVNLAFKGGHWRVPGAFNFSYGKQNQVLSERELTLLATPTYQQGRCKFYTLSDAERSNLRAIAHRFVNGLGAGYDVYRDTLGNTVGLSYFLLYEDTRYLTELHRQVLRHSFRLKTHFTRGISTLDVLAYYQPAVGNPAGDYRANGTAVLSVRLARHLALAVNYAYSLESINVAGRAPVNTNLSVGFTYAVGK
ncbi:DUF481 domain-containing protein [Hymenobacter caeli]|uniref:DUF481 domain-containing protein n=1 Tax=Hymenobacter caeli TaxID=2735894 RepID=A0ABX2FVX2_9BACT|nr:DUF481 domain-containing protein [Hymenobacter caeli]NRT21368.1 hypothetical protein [Hymenobacter caeli]